MPSTGLRPANPSVNLTAGDSLITRANGASPEIGVESVQV